MPSYRVQHTTLYKYADPVPVCHNLAHLLPRDSADHRWTSAEIDIHPVPAIRAARLDYFGNRLTFFAIQEPHRKLQVTATSNVEVTRTSVRHHSPPPTAHGKTRRRFFIRPRTNRPSFLMRSNSFLNRRSSNGRPMFMPTRGSHSPPNAR